jgi:hypothetical protein
MFMVKGRYSEGGQSRQSLSKEIQKLWSDIPDAEIELPELYIRRESLQKRFEGRYITPYPAG